MVSIVRTAAIIALAACGKPRPVAAPVAASTDPEELALMTTWIIESHMLVKGASVTDADATGFHGRTIAITEEGYTSPFQPACARAARVKQVRELGEVIEELEVAGEGATVAAASGMTSDLVEWRLTCTDRGKPPPLLIWVGGKHAMTCSSGACYLMKHFDD